MTFRAAIAARGFAVAGATLLATGCAVFSPVQTTENYIPADGVPLSIPGLELRNLAVIATADGGPGVVVGQAVNSSVNALDVAFSVGEEGTPVTAVIPAGFGGSLSNGTDNVDLAAVPAPPGALVELVVTTERAGQNVVEVPVFAPEGDYADFVG
ncbi:MAG: hypothetical protein ACRCYX_13915 [Dermatophilaceae bacterium]